MTETPKKFQHKYLLPVGIDQRYIKPGNVKNIIRILKMIVVPSIQGRFPVIFCCSFR